MDCLVIAAALRSTRARELVDAVGLDVPLAVQVELALDLHFHPQALAVEPVLPALVEALHRLVALVEVLIRAAPRVMDAHRLDVGGDRSVDERVPRPAGVLAAQRLEALLALPQVEHAVLELRQVESRSDRCESRFLLRRHLRAFSRKTKTPSRHLGTASSRGTTQVGAACVHSLRL